MSVFDILEAMPNRVLALAEVVGSEGVVPREELARRIVPGVESLDQFKNLLRESLRLGVVIDDKVSGGIRLSDDIAPKQLRERKKFVATCLNALIPNEGDCDEGNKTYSRALAWLLTRPIGLNLEAGGEFQTALSRDLEGPEIYDLTNASRSSMLIYWAHFMGFTEWIVLDGKSYCNPDPTRAMAAAIKNIIEKKHATPVAEFFQRLGRVVPVFETGRIRKEVEDRLKKPRDETFISQSSSLALARLEDRGAIKIEPLPDAPTLLMVGMDNEQRPISHITLL